MGAVLVGFSAYRIIRRVRVHDRAPLSHENPVSVALPLCLECHGGDDRARAKLHPCTPP